MNRKYLLLSIVLQITTAFYSFGQLLPSQDIRAWNIVFEDSMNYFNNNLWYKSNNSTHGEGVNEEPQVYMSAYAYISNNKLVLLTDRLTSPVSHPNYSNNCYYNNQHNYVSGQIVSQNTYQYGYYEIYAQIPAYIGSWPAFWLWKDNDYIQDPWYNEIDIFEGNGALTNSLGTNCWWSFTYPVNNYLQQAQQDFISQNYAQAYHWYGLKWDKNEIVWYYDRQQVRFEANDFGNEGIHHPLRIFINSALRPTSWDNSVTNSTPFPQYMLVDQVNMYQMDCQDKNIVVNEILDFSNYNYLVKKSISLSSATTLPNNDNIVLYASDFIKLDNGFSVPLGTSLYLDCCDACP